MNNGGELLSVQVMAFTNEGQIRLEWRIRRGGMEYGLSRPVCPDELQGYDLLDIIWAEALAEIREYPPFDKTGIPSRRKNR